MFKARGAALALASIPVLSSCAPREPPPPTEHLLMVTSPLAPLLTSVKAGKHATLVGWTGDLAELRKDWPPLKWRANIMDGVPGERQGPMVEVRLSPDGLIAYGFRSDFGAEVDAPAASWICDRLSRDPALPPAARATECARSLHRSRAADGAFVAWVPCNAGPCPVATIRGGKLAAVAVPGLGNARLCSFDGRSVLLASTRWTRAEGAESGGSVVAVSLSGPSPTLGKTLRLDEIDSRAADTVRSRAVNVRVEGSVVRLTGEERVVSRADGREITRTPIDEAHDLR